MGQRLNGLVSTVNALRMVQEVSLGEARTHRLELSFVRSNTFTGVLLLEV